MHQQSAIRNVAFLGDYLPRKCGIATLTTYLRCAVAARELVIPYAMSDSATSFATVSLDELLRAMQNLPFSH